MIIYIIWFSFQLLLLQKEACALHAIVQTRADTESELKTLKEQWSMKQRVLRTLATKNSVEHRKRTKQFRERLEAYVRLQKKKARKATVIPSCTSEGKTNYQKPLLTILL